MRPLAGFIIGCYARFAPVTRRAACSCRKQLFVIHAQLRVETRSWSQGDTCLVIPDLTRSYRRTDCFYFGLRRSFRACMGRPCRAMAHMGRGGQIHTMVDFFFGAGLPKNTELLITNWTYSWGYFLTPTSPTTTPCPAEDFVG